MSLQVSSRWDSSVLKISQKLNKPSLKIFEDLCSSLSENVNTFSLYLKKSNLSDFKELSLESELNVNIEIEGEYKIKTSSNKAFDLYINDILLLEDFQSSTPEESIKLLKGVNKIRIELKPRNFFLIVEPYIRNSGVCDFILIDSAVEPNQKSAMFLISVCSDLEDYQDKFNKMHKCFADIATSIEWQDKSEKVKEKNSKFFFNPNFAVHKCLVCLKGIDKKPKMDSPFLKNCQIEEIKDFKEKFCKKIDEKVRFLWKKSKVSKNNTRDFGFDDILASSISRKKAQPFSAHGYPEVSWSWQESERYWSVSDDDTEGRRQRLKGSAGSGKSYIIAKRAIENAKRGRRVLVTCYNITMEKNIEFFAKRILNKKPKEELMSHDEWEIEREEILRRIDFEYFHSLIPKELYEGEGALSSEELCCLIPKNFNNLLLEEDVWYGNYDAVLIDEGQDFTEEMLECLKTIGLKGKQKDFLICGDPDQNIYGRKEAFFTNKPMTGFRGRFLELKATHRLAPDIIDAANEFGNIFVEDYEAVVQHQNLLDFLKPWFLWENFQDGDYSSAFIRIKKVLSYWLSEDKHLSASDIVFLVGSEDVGNKVKDNFLRDYCKEKKWRLRDIFTYDSRSTKYGYYESRSKKQAFDPNEYGKNDFKLVTIESFKGWESNRVIAIIEPDEARSKSKIQQSSRRVLNAMTRSRNGIFVLNFNDRYKDFPSQKFNS